MIHNVRLADQSAAHLHMDYQLRFTNIGQSKQSINLVDARL